MGGTAPWRSSLAFIVDMEHRPGTTSGIRLLKKKPINKNERNNIEEGDTKPNTLQRATPDVISREEEREEGEQGDVYQLPDEILLHYAKMGDLAGLEEHILQHRHSPKQRLQFKTNCTDRCVPAHHFTIILFLCN